MVKKSQGATCGFEKQFYPNQNIKDTQIGLNNVDKSGPL